MVFLTQVLFHLAGIVFLTLVINGTTTTKLLDYLKITQTSEAHKLLLESALQQILGSRARTIKSLKHDRFLADVDWDKVERFTTIPHPYV